MRNDDEYEKVQFLAGLVLGVSLAETAGGVQVQV
jgi:hypothetical protein